MQISMFDKSNKKYIKEASELLIESFPHCYSDSALEEVEMCLSEDRIAVMAVENNQLVGFAGAIPQYGVTGWELHPLVVRKSHQFKGIGTLLIKALEQEVAKRGGVTIYLGTDDEFNKTSLSNCNLYEDLFDKIANIKNLTNIHMSFT